MEDLASKKITLRCARILFPCRSFEDMYLHLARYFDIRGKGEPIRLLFEEAGIKYEDVRSTALCCCVQHCYVHFFFSN
jgi:hypothetical protein